MVGAWSGGGLYPSGRHSDPSHAQLGSLYQGEELGLKETELSFADLVDPYGIEFKDRDGCRTPMVWQSHATNGAFSTANRTWLPVPAEHMTHAVDTQDKVDGSILEFYRAMLTFRKTHPALAKGSIELPQAGRCAGLHPSAG